MKPTYFYAISIVFLLGFGQALMAQETEVQALIRTISVNGEAQIEVEPDEARFFVTIEQKEKTSLEALDGVEKRSSRLLELLERYEIDPKDIQSSDIRIDFIYGDDGFFGKPEAYIARNSLRVKVGDLEILPELLPALTSAGATEFGGLQFDYTKREEAKDEAMVLAVGDALDTAQKLADAAGMSVGDPIQINFGHVNFDAPVMRSAEAPVLMEMAQADGAQAKISISPGTIRISSDVAIQYEMREQ